ncbi:argininosuccinate lyase [Rhizobiales bacterium GAS113]|nr:argininosuccinate lyase [Rhizobiales bacterium GAS113]
MQPEGPQDTTEFPDPVYKDTVLVPLFDDAKTQHAGDLDRINRAQAVMLHEVGLLDLDHARALMRGLVEISRSLDPEKLVYDGSVEDLFFLIENELIGRVGKDIAGRLHTGRSRNDIDHTLFKMSLKRELDGLLKRSLRLLGALIDKAEAESASLIIAYTHGQPAQPGTFGHYLGAMIEVLIRDIERVLAARRVVDLCSMGAAAITTSGFPLDRRRMAELLGFSAAQENSYGCIAAADYVTSAYSALQLIFLHLGRPIQDLQFWTSFEVAQLYVPNAFVQISSIMPQKRNPVPIEHLRHLASQVVGRAGAMLTVVHNTPFTDINDIEGETQSFGYGAFRTAARVLDLLTALVPALSVRQDRVDRNSRKSCITITELADSLVRIEGISFRQAHHVAAAVARAVVGVDGELAVDGYAPFVAAFAAEAGRASRIDRERFVEIVSARHFVEVRSNFGGPAPDPMARALAKYRSEMARFEDEHQANADREAAAIRRLDERTAALQGE